MKLEWMGRYRDIIRNICRNSNVCARLYTEKIMEGDDLVLTPLEWQTLECILEYEDENYNMTILSGKISVPQSNFSKYVKSLIKSNLVERFQKGNNNKDIILKLTNRGREFYHINSRQIELKWRDIFAVLDDFSDEQLACFSLFVSKLTDSIDPYQPEPIELIKKE